MDSDAEASTRKRKRESQGSPEEADSPSESSSTKKLAYVRGVLAQYVASFGDGGSERSNNYAEVDEGGASSMSSSNDGTSSTSGSDDGRSSSPRDTSNAAESNSGNENEGNKSDFDQSRDKKVRATKTPVQSATSRFPTQSGSANKVTEESSSAGGSVSGSSKTFSWNSNRPEGSGLAANSSGTAVKGGPSSQPGATATTTSSLSCSNTDGSANDGTSSTTSSSNNSRDEADKGPRKVRKTSTTATAGTAHHHRRHPPPSSGGTDQEQQEDQAQQKPQAQHKKSSSKKTSSSSSKKKHAAQRQRTRDEGEDDGDDEDSPNSNSSSNDGASTTSGSDDGKHDSRKKQSATVQEGQGHSQSQAVASTRTRPEQSSESSRCPDTTASSSNNESSSNHEGSSSGSDDGRGQGQSNDVTAKEANAASVSKAAAFFGNSQVEGTEGGEVSALSSSNDGSSDDRPSNKSEQDTQSTSNSSSGGSSGENDKKQSAEPSNTKNVTGDKRSSSSSSGSSKPPPKAAVQHTSHHHHAHNVKVSSSSSASSSVAMLPHRQKPGSQSAASSTTMQIKKKAKISPRLPMTTTIPASATIRMAARRTAPSVMPNFAEEPIPPNETKEEKKRRMNRITAKKKRARQKIEIDVLNEQCAELTSLNQTLQAENEHLEQTLDMVNQLVAMSGLEPVEPGSAPPPQATQAPSQVLAQQAPIQSSAPATVPQVMPPFGSSNTGAPSSSIQYPQAGSQLQRAGMDTSVATSTDLSSQPLSLPAQGMDASTSSTVSQPQQVLQGFTPEQQQALTTLLSNCNNGDVNGALQQLMNSNGDIADQLQQLLRNVNGAGSVNGGGASGSSQNQPPPPSSQSQHSATIRQPEQRTPQAPTSFQEQHSAYQGSQQPPLNQGWLPPQNQHPMPQQFQPQQFYQPQQYQQPQQFQQPQQQFQHSQHSNFVPPTQISSAQQQPTHNSTPLESLAEQLQQLIRAGQLTSAQAQQLLMTAASTNGQVPTVQQSGGTTMERSSSQNGTQGSSIPNQRVPANQGWNTSSNSGLSSAHAQQHQYLPSNAGNVNYTNQMQHLNFAATANNSSATQRTSNNGGAGGEGNDLASQARQLLSGNNALAQQAQQLLSVGLNNISANSASDGVSSLSSQAQSLADQIVRAAGATNVAQLLQSLGQQQQQQPPP